MSQFKMDLSHNFKGIKARSKSIQQVVRHAEQQGMTHANDFAGDIFNALYQRDPQLKMADDSQYSQALRAALQSPQFQHIRQQTQGSAHWSSAGASLIASTLAEELEWNKEEEPPEEPPQEPAKGYGTGVLSKEKGEKSDDEIIIDNILPNPDEDNEDNDKEQDESDSNEPSPESNDGPEESESENNSGESSKGSEQSENQNPGEQSSDEPTNEDGEEDSDNESDGDSDNDSDNESDELEESDFDENDGENSGDSDSENEKESEPLKPIDQSIKDALNKASKELDEMMGGIRAGTSDSMYGAKQESELADLYSSLANNPRLRQILGMVGRMQINQHFLNGIAPAENTSPMSVTTGRDIPNVLPQDLGLLLGNNEEFMVFATKYNNRELLQREFESHTQPGKGPIIVCVDESGSMDGPKRDWAVAIAAAMYMQALKEGRQFAMIKFASRMMRLPLPKGRRIDPDFMEQVAKQGFLGGGTDFASAWQDATNIIQSGPQWKNADIVFLTDGFGRFDPNVWEKDKERLHIRLFMFFIDPDGLLKMYLQQGNDLLTKLIELSDAMTLIEDLSEKGEKQAFNIIRNKDARGFFEIGKNAQVVSPTF